ncbi:unnamed protein product [Pocillopora meandrina]|uniref:Sacsin/Nov domain-containing protein n=1 Tax=Pocillopora meandrina TaxID=46732 RepID=A0AAU9WW06_9CNID|nr:unnamed protein product [Pocillopora meandrina]
MSKTPVTLARLCEPSRVVVKQIYGHYLDNGVSDILIKLGVLIMTDYPSFIGNHPAVLGRFVYPPSVEGVLKAMVVSSTMMTSGKLPEIVRTVLSTREKQLLRSFLVDIKGTQVGQAEYGVLCCLPVFETLAKKFVSAKDGLCAAPPEPLPITIRRDLVDVSQQDSMAFALLLGVKILTPVELLCQVVFPDIKRGCYSEEQIDKLMEHVLDRYVSAIRKNAYFKRNLQDLAFVSRQKGRARPCELFDPRNAIVKTLFVHEDVFPSHTYRDEITANDLYHSAQMISKFPNIPSLKEKSKGILQFLNEDPQKMLDLVSGQPLGMLLITIPWVSRQEQRPYDYPSSLPYWKTEEEENRRFFKPFELKSHQFANLIGTVMPVVDVDECETISQFFGWQDEPPVNQVVQHLETAVRYYSEEQKPYYIVMLTEIYRYLGEHHHDVHEAFDATNVFPWVWNGDGFSLPSHLLATRPPIDLTPYIRCLPVDLRQHCRLFKYFGMQKECDPSILTQVLRMIKLSVNILNELASGELSEALHGDILIPIYQEENSYVSLQPVGNCMYGEQNDDEEIDYFYVHPNVPNVTAERLGVPSITNRLLDADELAIGEEFGQGEKLTTRLNRLLEEYTDGFSVLKELIQNADDAGATEVKFLYDQRTNEEAMTSLIDEGMKGCQGPALWVYNDATFKDEDFENITKLNEATKQHDTEKIGRFGLGFNAVYNLTDVPMFISRNNFVIFDPHTSYLGKALKNKTKPGMKINVNKEVTRLRKTRQVIELTKSSLKVNVNCVFTECGLRFFKPDAATTHPERTTWLIVSSMGDGRALKFAENDFSLLPSGGVAVKLAARGADKFVPVPVFKNDDGVDVNGTLFCYLPLPIHTYVCLLEDLRSIVPTDGSYRFHSLWPKADEVFPNLRHLTQSFYTQISTGTHALLSDGENWFTINEVIFLHPVLRNDPSIGDTSFKVFQLLMSERAVVIDVPLSVVDSFQSCGSEEVINSKMYDKNRFFRQVFFPNISAVPSEMRDALVLHAMDNNCDDLVKAHSCIPASPLGNSLRRPSELIHPGKEAARLFLPEDGRFPWGNAETFLNPGRLAKLELLGMASEYLPWQEMAERAESINKLNALNSKAAEERAIEFVNSLEKKIKCKDETYSDLTRQRILEAQFLPALNKPYHLCSLKPLIGLSISRDVKEFLKLRKKKAELNHVILQLKVAMCSEVESSKAKAIEEINSVCRAVYSYLERAIIKGATIKDILLNERYILHEGEFLYPSQVAFHLNDDCAPYLYQLPKRLAEDFPNLLRVSGVKERFDEKDFILALRKIKELFPENDLDEKNLKVAGNPPHCEKKMGTIYLPDSRAVMKAVSELCFKDCPWMPDEEGVHFVHAKIPWSSIQTLGEGSKGEDPNKTGQYGVGFNAVYHLTDVPSFVSHGEEIGDVLCVFDPHCKYLPGATPLEPGGRFNDTATLSKKFPDVFPCYLLDHFKIDDATMFRFPLRTKDMARESEITSNSVSVEELDFMMEGLRKELFEVLLFVKNVRKITLCEVDKADGKLANSYTVEAALSKKDEAKREEFTDYIKQIGKSAKKRGVIDLRKIPVKKVSYVLNITDTRGNAEKWLIVQQVGFEKDVDENIIRAFRKKELGMLPRGGVACLLEKNSRYTSSRQKKAYCFLPLPLETNLPVHVNGHFALDHEARRSLWRDEGDHGGYRSDWNNALLTDVVTSCYISMLVEIRKFLKLPTTQDGSPQTECEIIRKINVYESYFPTKIPTDQYWKTLVRSNLARLRKLFKDILLESGFNLVVSTLALHNSFQRAGVTTCCVSPRKVIDFYKTLSSGDRLCSIGPVPCDVHKTSLKSVLGNFLEALPGLPLLLTQDQHLKLFSNEDPKFLSQYKDLLPGSPHIFLHDEVYKRVFKGFDDNRLSCLRPLDATSFATYLPHTLSLETYGSGRFIEWSPNQREIPNQGWMFKAWMFLSELVKSVINDVEKDEELKIHQVQTTLKPLMDWSILPVTETKKAKRKSPLAIFFPLSTTPTIKTICSL